MKMVLAECVRSGYRVAPVCSDLTITLRVACVTAKFDWEFPCLAFSFEIEAGILIWMAASPLPTPSRAA
jgi:hypothetical protein